MIAVLFVAVVATSATMAQTETPCPVKGDFGPAVSGPASSGDKRVVSTNPIPEALVKSSINEPVRIVSKPIAVRTDKQDCAEGFVYLRIQFLSSGLIGKIAVVSGLTKGLNRDAIAAAKKIRFEVAKKNGKPTTVFKTLRYSFRIY